MQWGDFASLMEVGVALNFGYPLFDKYVDQLADKGKKIIQGYVDVQLGDGSMEYSEKNRRRISGSGEYFQRKCDSLGKWSDWGKVPSGVMGVSCLGLLIYAAYNAERLISNGIGFSIVFLAISSFTFALLIPYLIRKYYCTLAKWHIKQVAVIAKDEQLNKFK